MVDTFFQWPAAPQATPKTAELGVEKGCVLLVTVAQCDPCVARGHSLKQPGRRQFGLGYCVHPRDNLPIIILLANAMGGVHRAGFMEMRLEEVNVIRTKTVPPNGRISGGRLGNQAYRTFSSLLGRHTKHTVTNCLSFPTYLNARNCSVLPGDGREHQDGPNSVLSHTPTGLGARRFYLYSLSHRGRDPQRHIIECQNKMGRGSLSRNPGAGFRPHAGLVSPH